LLSPPKLFEGSLWKRRKEKKEKVYICPMMKVSGATSQEPCVLLRQWFKRRIFKYESAGTAKQDVIRSCQRFTRHYNSRRYLNLPPFQVIQLNTGVTFCAPLVVWFWFCFFWVRRRASSMKVERTLTETVSACWNQRPLQ
jgi:hypothetical protein